MQQERGDVITWRVSSASLMFSFDSPTTSSFCFSNLSLVDAPAPSAFDCTQRFNSQEKNSARVPGDLRQNSTGNAGSDAYNGTRCASGDGGTYTRQQQQHIHDNALIHAQHCKEVLHIWWGVEYRPKAKSSKA